MQALHDANETFAHLLQIFADRISERPVNAELDFNTAPRCDEELHTLRSVQKALDRRVALVCRKRNTFAPINTLPPELLVAIFAIATDNTSGTACSGHATLSLVCQYWNRLVNTTPSLWTKIHADTMSAARIVQAIEKSQNAPLDIYTSWISEQGKLDALLKAILPQAHRWREASLALGEPLRGLEVMATLSTPLLEYLSLSIDESYGWVSEEPLNLFGGRPSPRLRRVFLRAVPVTWSPTVLCHLTVLSIGQIRHLGPSLDQLMAVLSACPDLETLSISGVSFSGGASTSALNPIHMPALGILKLCMLGTALLFASIHAPNRRSGDLICRVPGDPMETLFTPDGSHFFDHIRSNPSGVSITYGPGLFTMNRTGPWFVALDVENIKFAKDTLIWLSSPSPIRMTISWPNSSLTDILPVVADLEALYQIHFAHDVPVSEAITLLAMSSSVQGRTLWPFPALVEVSIERGLLGEDWEKLLLMLRRRQGALESRDDPQNPKPLRKLVFGSDFHWSVQADAPVIANFSSTYWPNRLDEVRRLLGPEGELIWYGRVVTEEGVLEDRATSGGFALE